jgi:hypothetical protein
VVPEPPTKHHTQPHQDAKLPSQKRRFCGKFSLPVLPVMVWLLIRNQQVVGSNPTGGSKNLAVRPGDIGNITYRLHR